MIYKAIYKAGGRDFPLLDCYGLVKYLYKKNLGVDIIDFDYKDPDNPENEKFFVESMNNPQWVKCKPKNGAVVGFKVNGYIAHCGYMINEKEFLHIMKNSGVALGNIKSDKWKNRVVGFYSFGVLND